MRARLVAAAAIFGVVPIAAAIAAALGGASVSAFLDDRAIELGVLAGFVRIFASARDGDDDRIIQARPREASPRRRGIEIAAVLLGAAILAFIGFGGYLRLDGVPAYRHDWAWPIDDIELRHVNAFLTADWRLEALGTPKPYPTLYPLLVLITALGTFAHTGAVLAALLIGCCGAAAAGMYALARGSLRSDVASSALAGVVYAAGPFLVDKTVAGHVHIVFAYALLPWLGVVQRAADRAPRRHVAAWIALAAALDALTMCALTFVAFSAVAMTALALTLRRRRRAFVVVVCATLLAICCDAQSFYHLATDRALDNGRSGFEWLTFLSARTDAILGGYSYLPGYARSAVPAWIVSASTLGVAPLVLAALGCTTVLGSTRAAAFALTGLLGVAGATGVYGPFAWLKDAAYAHVHALAAFREFYNFESLLALGLCGTLAWFLTRCGAWLWCGSTAHKIAGGAAWLAAGASLATVVIPFVRGTASAVPTYRESTTLLTLAHRLDANQDRGERVAFFPLVQPLRPGDDPFGGTDPFALGFREHPTLAEWQPGAPVALAAVDAVAGHIDATQRLLDAFGARWIVLRGGVSSAAADFWYPHTFAPAWGANADQTALSGSSHFARIARGDGLTVLENPHALPLLSLVPPAVRCSGDPLLTLAAGRCTRTIDHAHAAPNANVNANAAAPDGSVDIPLAPDAREVDPNVAWTAIKAAYGLAPSLAAARTGIVTLGSAAWTTTFATQGARELYIRCAASESLHLDLDGNRVAVNCHTDFERAMPWVDAGPIAAGPHRIVAISAEGVSAIERIVSAPHAFADPQAALSSFAWSPLQARASLGSVEFARTSATEVHGAAHVMTSALLLFGDSYDARWQLEIAGREPLAAQPVDGFANGFPLEPGAYKFTLRYVPRVLDAAFENLQSLTWYIFVTTLVFTVAFEIARRRRAIGVPRLETAVAAASAPREEIPECERSIGHGR